MGEKNGVMYNQKLPLQVQGIMFTTKPPNGVKPTALAEGGALKKSPKTEIINTEKRIIFIFFTQINYTP